MELYILPLGMANRMWSHMRMDSQSQSHALSRGGCALQRLAAGQTGRGGVRLPIKAKLCYDGTHGAICRLLAAGMPAND